MTKEIIEILEDDELEQENAAMGEQMDAERAAFEAAYADSQGFEEKAYGLWFKKIGGEYEIAQVASAWWGWQKARSLPVGVPSIRDFADEVKQLCKDFSDLQNRPYMGDVTAAIDGLYEQFMQSDAMLDAAPSVKANKAQPEVAENTGSHAMANQLQRQGLAVSAEVDGAATPSEASDADDRKCEAPNCGCADAFCKAWPDQDDAAPTFKAEQVQCNTCNDTAMVGDLPIECPDCCRDEAPSLPAAGSELTASQCACGDEYPANSYGAGFMAANNGICENCDAANSCASEPMPAAGSAVEDVEVVAHFQIPTGGSYAGERFTRLGPVPDTPAANRTYEPLMTVAQHKRIVVQIAARDAGVVRVPVELAERLIDPYRREPRSIHLHNEDCDELRALLAQREQRGGE